MNKSETIPPPIEGFNAVDMMREIREKLSERYWKHPDILQKDMEEIRTKYNFNSGEPQRHKDTKAH
jgi:hypothetical protein